MNLTEKVSYLKGLMEGLSIDENSPEGKIFAAMFDLLDDMALTVTELEGSVTEMEELVDIIDEDLGAVEEELFDDDVDDEDYYELDCPNCGELICMDTELAKEGEIECPACGEKIEFDLEDDCDCCDCCCDEDTDEE